MSIVSTKIPFKGTGKEYIGDDITEIATAVKVKKNTSTFTTKVHNYDAKYVCISVRDSTVLYSAEVQDTEKNTGSRAARAKEKPEQVKSIAQLMIVCGNDLVN